MRWLRRRWSLLLLLIAIAVAAALHLFTPEQHTAIFLASGVAIVLLASYIGHATETLARQLGGGIGGLLNATFGNASELIIGILALRRGLDNEVGGSEGGMVSDGRDAVEQRVGVGLRHLFLRDEAAERLGDAGLAGFGAREVDVREEHIMAGACRNLRDARAHLSRTDNADDHDMPFR